MLDDPVLLVSAVAAARCLACLAGAYAERLRARARVELVEAAGRLPVGTEIGERGLAGSGWTARTTGRSLDGGSDAR